MEMDCTALASLFLSVMCRNCAGCERYELNMAGWISASGDTGPVRVVFNPMNAGIYIFLQENDMSQRIFFLYNSAERNRMLELCISAMDTSVFHTCGSSYSI